MSLLEITDSAYFRLLLTNCVACCYQTHVTVDEIYRECAWNSMNLLHAGKIQTDMNINLWSGDLIHRKWCHCWSNCHSNSWRPRWNMWYILYWNSASPIENFRHLKKKNQWFLFISRFNQLYENCQFWNNMYSYSWCSLNYLDISRSIYFCSNPTFGFQYLPPLKKSSEIRISWPERYVKEKYYDIVVINKKCLWNFNKKYQFFV